jgi:hypothetical protein
MESCARIEAKNLLRNGAARYFEQVYAFLCRCDHEHPRLTRTSVFRMPTVRQFLDQERNLQLWQQVYQMGSGFSRKFCTSAHV